ncbi:hypothetical protein B7P43_G00705 [Cryptotermes secundus]|uniref:Uncharacterized protein n=1 Tax=Cryptotermes secundus TaxID=105785 RepID=A0A2J7QUB0_9NEOP|nr:hypothetical protein B7P43_G00705 [Cryptotermes secundus]
MYGMIHKTGKDRDGSKWQIADKKWNLLSKRCPRFFVGLRRQGVIKLRKMV